MEHSSRYRHELICVLNTLVDCYFLNLLKRFQDLFFIVESAVIHEGVELLLLVLMLDAAEDQFDGLKLEAIGYVPNGLQ